MKQISSVKRVCICAVCIALCYVLPIVFHAVGLGGSLSPMHLPVLLCGLICGWGCGAICGILGPVLSSVLSGMPPAVKLVTMVPELCVYGLVAGLLLRFVHTKNTYADLYLALLGAMLLGRMAGGVAKVLFYLTGLSGMSSLTFGMLVQSYFVQSLPAIVLQLVVLPTLVFVLMKAKLLPARYPKNV